MQIGELALDAAHVLEPQDGAAADDVALRLDRAAGERRERHGEAFAARAQVRRPALRSPARLVGVEPGAEGEHAMRRVGVGHEGGVADDLGLVVGGGPGHQDLRIGAQQHVDAVDLGAGGDDLVAREASVSASRRRVRTSMIAVTTAKHRMPSVSASAAISWRSSCAKASR